MRPIITPTQDPDIYYGGDGSEAAASAASAQMSATSVITNGTKVTTRVGGSGKVSLEVEKSGEANVATLTSTSDAYASATAYDRVSITLNYSKPGTASTEALYLTKDTPLTRKNLVGYGGYFNVTVKYFTNVTVVSGDEITHIGDVADKEETYTLDQWIEKATGKQLNAAGDAWVDGGTAANGYYIDLDMASSTPSSGPSLAGELTVTLKLVAMLTDDSDAHHRYGVARATFKVTVKASEGWYADAGSATIELMPVKALGPVVASFDDSKTFVEVAKAGDYLLISSEYAAAVPTLTTSGATTQATYKIDKSTDEYHQFVSGYEIYGVMRNALDGWTANATIPSAGEVVLFHDYVPPVDGESNIEVLYPCYVDGNSERIDRCRVAKLFGNANAKNRLFLSGNPDLPNCDWHSSSRNSYLDSRQGVGSNGDFTYFGDEDYNFYGQTDNAVMGYDIVATDKMVVIKSRSKVEPTNYFRISSMTQVVDATGVATYGLDGSALYEESFKMATGNIGPGAMNMRSVVNLNGDTLYLSSENSVCGLDISGQVGDSQRISYSRSRLIDPELKDLDLSDAVLWTDNVFAYLFAEDATYVTHYETFSPETGQYEWFKTDVKGVRCALDADGVTYLGTSEGALYRFEKGRFSDCSKVFLNVGATLYANDRVTYSSAYNGELGDGTGLTFKPRASALATSLFRRAVSLMATASAGCDLAVDGDDSTLMRIAALDGSGNYDPERHKEIVGELAQSKPLYANHLQGEDSIRVSEGSPLETYYAPLKAVEGDEPGTYSLIDEDGDPIDLADVESIDLCRVLDGEYEVFGLDKTNCRFGLKENGREIDVALYADQNMSVLSFPSEIHVHKPVKAYFVAAPATLGDVSYRKTVWAWTLSAFREPNDLQVCQATNEEQLDDMRALGFADSVPIGLDYRDFSVAETDYAKSVVPRKYTYLRPISVPFVSFGFRSVKDANSILTATSVVYSIPMLGRGGD